MSLCGATDNTWPDRIYNQICRKLACFFFLLFDRHWEKLKHTPPSIRRHHRVVVMGFFIGASLAIFHLLLMVVSITLAVQLTTTIMREMSMRREFVI